MLRKRLTCSNLQQVGNIFFVQTQRSPLVKSEKVLTCHPLLGLHHHCSFGQQLEIDLTIKDRDLHKIRLLHRRSAAGTPSHSAPAGSESSPGCTPFPVA
jgi:hypothetical protein